MHCRRCRTAGKRPTTGLSSMSTARLGKRPRRKRGLSSPSTATWRPPGPSSSSGSTPEGPNAVDPDAARTATRGAGRASGASRAVGSRRLGLRQPRAWRCDRQLRLRHRGRIRRGRDGAAARVARTRAPRGGGTGGRSMARVRQSDRAVRRRHRHPPGEAGARRRPSRRCTSRAGKEAWGHLGAQLLQDRRGYLMCLPLSVSRMQPSPRDWPPPGPPNRREDCLVPASSRTPHTDRIYCPPIAGSARR